MVLKRTEVMRARQKVIKRVGVWEVILWDLVTRKVEV